MGLDEDNLVYYLNKALKLNHVEVYFQDEDPITFFVVNGSTIEKITLNHTSNGTPFYSSYTRDGGREFLPSWNIFKLLTVSHFVHNEQNMGLTLEVESLVSIEPEKNKFDCWTFIPPEEKKDFQPTWWEKIWSTFC